MSLSQTCDKSVQEWYDGILIGLVDCTGATGKQNAQRVLSKENLKTGSSIEMTWIHSVSTHCGLSQKEEEFLIVLLIQGKG